MSSSATVYYTLLPNFEVRLTTHALPGTTWKAHVTFNDPLHNDGQRSVILAASMETHIPYILPSPPAFYTTAVLKSNLQKAVRRGHVDAAVATAWQMARQGPTDLTELFRRLPIILLEDTLLHADILARWVWWMLASTRGWVLSEDEWSQLLLDVAFVANTEAWGYRECLHKTDKTQSPAALFENGTPYTESQKAALFALWARSQWGGMLGDMAFLRALYVTWTARDPKGTHWRLATMTDPSAEFPVVLAPLDSLHFSVADHALPEAVDFHCVPHMVFEIAQRTGAPKHLVQDAIWFCRSSVNRRSFVCVTSEDHSEHTQHEPPHEPPYELQDLFQRMDFTPYVRRAWAAKPPPSRTQATMLRYVYATGAVVQAQAPKDDFPKRTQSASPWISQH